LKTPQFTPKPGTASSNIWNQTTGKKVVFFPVQSNAAEIEAMRSGRLQVAGFNTGSNPIAVNCAGFVPFAIMGNKENQFRLRNGNHRAG
jgi:hypothetical protein